MNMDRNNGQNPDDEIEMVPIIPATNDVFSPGFCSLMHSTFKSTTKTHEAKHAAAATAEN
jgi:hypothetical protein